LLDLLSWKGDAWQDESRSTDNRPQDNVVRKHSSPLPAAGLSARRSHAIKNA
jgi:hypothetical protein